MVSGTSDPPERTELRGLLRRLVVAVQQTARPVLA
jgi:hypothetical protein